MYSLKNVYDYVKFNYSPEILDVITDKRASPLTYGATTCLSHFG